MKYIITVIIVGALIQSFLHTTRGKVSAFEKMFGGIYSLTFIILTIFSIIKFGFINLLIMPLVFLISNLVFTVAFEKMFKNMYKPHKKNNNEETNIKELLKTIIVNLAEENYSYKFVNGGYNYSKEITDIFKVINDDKLHKVYEEKILNYNSKEKKELIEKKDPLKFNYVESIVYINWLWHLEGTGLATGIVLNHIKNMKYLYALKVLYDSMD